MRTVAEVALVALLFIAAACGKSDESSEPSAGASSSDESAGVPETAGGSPELELAKPDDTAGGEVGLKLPQKAVDTPAEKTLGQRCALDVALPAGKCIDLTLGDIAAGPDGAVYLMEHEAGVRRLVVQQGDGCTLAADDSFGEGGQLPLPKPPPVGQKLDGKIYMRSGGAKFAFAAGPGGSIYIYDYLDGVHRIAGKAGPAACIGVLGLNAVAFTGKKPLAARGGDLVPLIARGKSCTAGKPKASPLNMITALLGDGRTLYVGGTSKDGKKRLVRVDGKKSTWTAGADDAFADGGLCWVNQITDCGDDLCVVDGNCNKVSRFAKKDGAFAGEWKNDALFGMSANKVQGLASGPDGVLWASVSMRRKDGSCEGAIYRIEPPGKAPAAGDVK